MKVSLDASAIIPLFIGDAFIDRIEAYLAMHAPALIVSDFAAAEFASVRCPGRARCAEHRYPASFGGNIDNFQQQNGH